MAEFKKKVLPLKKIKANQQNPRIISESKLKKLINSLLVFPKMMSLRPITVDGDFFVLGGNMRQYANLGWNGPMLFHLLEILLGVFHITQTIVTNCSMLDRHARSSLRYIFGFEYYKLSGFTHCYKLYKSPNCNSTQKKVQYV